MPATIDVKDATGSTVTVAANPTKGTAGTPSTEVISVQGVVSGTALPVSWAASENHIGSLGGEGVSVTVAFTRPADTTGYTAGDIVSNSTSATTLMDFANIARVNSGTIYITGARLITDKKSITPRFRVHLFNANNPTVSADNAAHKELYADESKRLGNFLLPAMATGTLTASSDMSKTEDYGLRVGPIAADSTKHIFAMLEALDAFTPASGENFSLTLYVDRN